MALTPEQRTYQRDTLKKYRDDKLIPSIQDIATHTGTGVSTVAQFMKGNANTEAIREYFRNLLPQPIPKDLSDLFAIWENDH